MNNRKCWPALFWSLNAFIPLICGVIIYLFIGGETYISVFVNKYLGLVLFPVSIPKEGFVRTALLFCRWYVCDILWAYSLAFCCAFVLKNSTKFLFLTAVICIAFETALEIGQKFEIIRGTFDYFDVFFESMSTGIALYVINRNIFQKGV